MKKLFISGILIFTIQQVFGQIELRSWNAASINLSLNKKTDIKVSHLRTFNVSQDFTASFNQSSIQAQQKLTKNSSVLAGYMYSTSPGESQGSSRIYLRLSHKFKLAKLISWSNSMQGEWHDQFQRNYRYRVIVSTKISPSKRLGFLRLSPSVAYSLFYNIQGAPIQYYDAKTAAKTVRQSPDGFHRGRLQFALNSKVSRSFSLTAFFMMQREFNFLSDSYHVINYSRPTDDKLIRPFSNYNVLGLSLAYNLKLYQSSHKRKMNNHEK